MGLPLLGAFIVNRDGKRFVREDVGPSELGALVLAQPGGVALEVFDQAHPRHRDAPGPVSRSLGRGRDHDGAERRGARGDGWFTEGFFN